MEDLVSYKSQKDFIENVEERDDLFQAYGYYEVAYILYREPSVLDNYYSFFYGSAAFYPMQSSLANSLITECAVESSSLLGKAIEINQDTLLDLSSLYLIEKSSFGKPLVFNDQGRERLNESFHDETRTGAYGAWVRLRGKISESRQGKRTISIREYEVDSCRTMVLTNGCARPNLGDLCLWEDGNVTDLSSNLPTLTLNTDQMDAQLSVKRDKNSVSLHIDADDHWLKTLERFSGSYYYLAHSYFELGILDELGLEEVTFQQEDKTATYLLDEEQQNWISPKETVFSSAGAEAEAVGLSLFLHSAESKLHIWGRPFVLCTRPEGQYSGPCVQ